MAERKNRSTRRKKADPKKNEMLFSILNADLSDRVILSSLDHDPQDDEDAKALKWCQNVFQDENGMVYEEYLVSFLMDTYSLCQNALRMFEDISSVCRSSGRERLRRTRSHNADFQRFAREHPEHLDGTGTFYLS